MRGGKNIKTTAQKKAEGTSRKDRDAGRIENIVPKLRAIPDAPNEFTPEMVLLWKQICAELLEVGLLTIRDEAALTIYVQNWVMAQVCWRDIQEKGMLVETAQGIVQNPSFRQYQECNRALKPLIEQFGGTPRARMGIRTDATDSRKVDPFEEFLTNEN